MRAKKKTPLGGGVFFAPFLGAFGEYLLTGERFFAHRFTYDCSLAKSCTCVMVSSVKSAISSAV
ncbi:hypothetical protein SPX_28820 [Sporomusa paucivorans]